LSIIISIIKFVIVNFNFNCRIAINASLINIVYLLINKFSLCTSFNLLIVLYLFYLKIYVSKTRNQIININNVDYINVNIAIVKFIIKLFSKLMYSLILEQSSFSYDKSKASNVIIKVFERLYNKLRKNNFNKVFVTFV